jgi:predicted  nucleic acid-binding Zn-ribbon protein
MAKVTTKLETRIMEAQTAGNDVSKLNASLTDMKAKIVDANVQATSAIGMVDPLVPDNGDKTLMEANKTTLKNAREKIKAAREDIVQAHKDAQTIQKALRTMKPKSAASSTSATTTTTP